MEGFVRESLLQEKVNGRVRCNVCERRCVIVPGGLGWCRPCAAALSAAEGENSCSPSASSNWPSARCQGTSISFNEPTLSLEWSLEVFRLARRRGLYNTYVTNGYMTPEALSLLIDAGLDAMNVDIKGDAAAVRRYCRGIDVEKVWATCRLARSRGVHVEVTRWSSPASVTAKQPCRRSRGGSPPISEPPSPGTSAGTARRTSSPHRRRRSRRWSAPGGSARRRGWSSSTRAMCQDIVAPTPTVLRAAPR